MTVVGVAKNSPSPTQMLSEYTPKQRPSHGSNGENSSHQAHQQRLFMERKDIHDDCDGAGLKTSGTQASDGTSKDQGHRVGSRAADCRANLEQDNGGHVDGFWWVEGIDLAHDELETGYYLIVKKKKHTNLGGFVVRIVFVERLTREHITAAVPTDIPKRLEVICYPRDSLSDDGSIECYEEERHHECKQDGHGNLCWRVFMTVGITIVWMLFFCRLVLFRRHVRLVC